MKAFYFANDSKTLRYNDNRRIVVGEAHEVEGEIMPCENGLHASTRLIDALKYAPGSNLYLVELSGTVVEKSDKVAASKRKYLAHYDATYLLRVFARQQALINIEKIKPYCSTEDYNLIVNYLNTGEERLRSAVVTAAYLAAKSAPELAEKSAAWSAASSADSAAWAAYSAVDAAVDSAAYAAVDSAAYAADSAVWSVACSAANKMLTDMVAEATGWDLSAVTG